MHLAAVNSTFLEVVIARFFQRFASLIFLTAYLSDPRRIVVTTCGPNVMSVIYPDFSNKISFLKARLVLFCRLNMLKEPNIELLVERVEISRFWCER